MKENDSRNSKTILSWIFSVAGKKKKYICYLIILQLIVGAGGVLSALILRQMIDAAVKGNAGDFRNSCLMFAGILLLQIVVKAGIRFLEEFTRADMENEFKGCLFGNLLNREYASVSGIHSEEWMNRLTSDTVVVADGLVQILPGLACMLMKMAAAFAAILALEVSLAYILIPGAILLMFTTYGFRRILKKLHKNIQEADGKLRVFMQEHLGSLVIVKTFSKEQSALDEAVEKMALHKRARMKRNHFSNLCNVGFAMAMNGVYLLGAVFCGYGILHGTMSYGTFVAITQLIGQVQNPLANITGYFPKYYAMLASGERMQEAEGFQIDATEKKSVGVIRGFYEQDFKGFGIENASFTYQDGQMVLHNLNLNIQKGEYVAFTGTSGCGKSTLLKLLMCLYSLDAGERYMLSENDKIMLDSSWRGLYAYVPQGNQLMSGTIREIIMFSDKKAMKNEEKLQWALKIACADEFVSELDQGLETELGERGMGLSEGQMQRIAIARAVFSEHPILMLDEATSSLDEVTERKVLENLRTMTDKTVLIVTHRLAVLDICDKQVEMSGGEVKIGRLR